MMIRYFYVFSIRYMQLEKVESLSVSFMTCVPVLEPNTHVGHAKYAQK